MYPLKGWFSEMKTCKLSDLSESRKREILSRGDVDLSDAMTKARAIIEDVRTGGDAALRVFADKFDGLKGGPLIVPLSEIQEASARVPKKVMDALEVSKRRIKAFHSKQVLEPFEYKDSAGLLGQRVVPIRRVGVYVPGGTADYVSSVLMSCIPAGIAGVSEIAICTPGKGGKVSDGILAAADLCGVREVHPIGGAHAIAAMAYGTESVRKVQKVVGPGGAFVTAAKLLVRNDCEIDFLAGPSEILVLADADSDPELIAADMLAQLEHDPLARAVLVTPCKELVVETKRVLRDKVARAGRSEIVRKAAEDGAIFIIAASLAEAVRFSNEYAPEHLLIDVKDPMRILRQIDSAGSVFLGRYSSVAFGDYCSGTNHVLPTKGAASMKSALSVYDFLKVIPYQRISAEGATKLSRTVDVLARLEGLPAHAEAALARKRRANR